MNRVEIDCTDNPLDIRPIVTEALRTYWAVKSQTPKTKVAFLCAHNHQISTQRLIASAILTHVSTAVFANEMQHNLYNSTVDLVHQAKPELMYAVKHVPLKIMEELDKNGSLTAAFFMQNCRTHGANETRNATWRYCMENGRKMAFIDSAKTMDGKKIDTSDATSARFCNSSKVDVVSSEGVAVRNEIMAYLACNQNSDIIIPNGLMHVVSRPKRDRHFVAHKESLATLIENNGMHVITILPNMQYDQPILDSNVPNLMNGHLIKAQGLDERQFNDDTWEEEILHAREVVSNSGGFMSPSLFR